MAKYVVLSPEYDQLLDRVECTDITHLGRDYWEGEAESPAKAKAAAVRHWRNEKGTDNYIKSRRGFMYDDNPFAGLEVHLFDQLFPEDKED